MAEGVGFEPTRAFALPVFKTGAINHSTTPPESCAAILTLAVGSARLRRNKVSTSGYVHVNLYL